MRYFPCLPKGPGSSNPSAPTHVRDVAARASRVPVGVGEPRGRSTCSGARGQRVGTGAGGRRGAGTGGRVATCDTDVAITTAGRAGVGARRRGARGVGARGVGAAGVHAGVRVGLL